MRYLLLAHVICAHALTDAVAETRRWSENACGPAGNNTPVLGISYNKDQMILATNPLSRFGGCIASRCALPDKKIPQTDT
jgi:hypothetical protein